MKALQRKVLEQIQCSPQVRRQIERQIADALRIGRTSTKITVTVSTSPSTENRQKPKDRRRFVLKGVNAKRNLK
jgi:hypothetical protein